MGATLSGPRVDLYGCNCGRGIRCCKCNRWYCPDMTGYDFLKQQQCNGDEHYLDEPDMERPDKCLVCDTTEDEDQQVGKQFDRQRSMCSACAQSNPDVCHGCGKSRNQVNIEKQQLEQRQNTCILCANPDEGYESDGDGHDAHKCQKTGHVFDFWK